MGIAVGPSGTGNTVQSSDAETTEAERAVAAEGLQKLNKLEARFADMRDRMSGLILHVDTHTATQKAFIEAFLSTLDDVEVDRYWEWDARLFR